jgi:HEAT repeat protein
MGSGYRQMKRIISILILTTCSLAFAQQSTDSINRTVDSLFIRASNGNVMYTDLVQPSKNALGQMGESAVPRLVEKMKTQDAREMQTLEDVFKLIGHSAVSYLVDALGSADNYRRRLSARILGEMADSSAVDGLLRYTNDSDFRLRSGVISALGKIGNPRGVSPSRLALADSDYLVRTSAAIALTNFKDSTTILPLIRGLSDPYYGVRYPAAQALANIGKPAIPFIMDNLNKPNDTLSFYLSIEIAGNLVDNRFTPKLDKIANSDDPYARAFAVEALGKIGTPEAMDVVHKRYDIETHPLVISKIEAIVLK